MIRLVMIVASAIIIDKLTATVASMEEGEAEGTGCSSSDCRSVVPYNLVKLLPFQDPSVEFRFAGKTWTIQQKWEDIGLSAVVWEAAPALCSYLEGLAPAFFEGKSFLELGAGTGLVGMVASALGAKSVVITDKHIESCRQNLAHNRHNLGLALADLEQNRGHVTISRLEWGQQKPKEEEGLSTFRDCCDVILGADVVYDKASFPLLLGTLEALSGPRTTVLLSHKHRYEENDGFFSLLELLAGFEVEVVWKRRDVSVYRAQRCRHTASPS